MAFKISIAKTAELDIEDIIDWYESRQLNLGDKFFVDLMSNIDYLINDPYCSAKNPKNIENLNYQNFPISSFNRF